MDKVPPELLFVIFEYLRAPDVRCRCICVCKEWRDVINMPQMWRSVFVGEFGTTLVDLSGYRKFQRQFLEVHNDTDYYASTPIRLNFVIDYEKWFKCFHWKGMTNNPTFKNRIIDKTIFDCVVMFIDFLDPITKFIYLDKVVYTLDKVYNVYWNIHTITKDTLTDNLYPEFVLSISKYIGRKHLFASWVVHRLIKDMGWYTEDFQCQLCITNFEFSRFASKNVRKLLVDHDPPKFIKYTNLVNSREFWEENVEKHPDVLVDNLGKVSLKTICFPKILKGLWNVYKNRDARTIIGVLSRLLWHFIIIPIIVVCVIFGGLICLFGNHISLKPKSNPNPNPKPTKDLYTPVNFEHFTDYTNSFPTYLAPHYEIWYGPCSYLCYAKPKTVYKQWKTQPNVSNYEYVFVKTCPPSNQLPLVVEICGTHPIEYSFFFFDYIDYYDSIDKGVVKIADGAVWILEMLDILLKVLEIYLKMWWMGIQTLMRMFMTIF